MKAPTFVETLQVDSEDKKQALLPGDSLLGLLIPHNSHLPMTRACPGCGLTLAELRQGAEVGCAGCYEAFSDVMPAVLRGLHGSVEHVGKGPTPRP